MRKMKKDISNNREYWNILKGVAIFSIVLGHSCPFGVAFVYLFHLVLFFFVSGYLYSENKYGDEPFYNVGMRIKSVWSKYFVYSTVLVLLHNTFLDIGVIIGQGKYSFEKILSGIANSVIFGCRETMGGALWFVPVLLAASGMFGGTVYLSRKIASRFSGEKTTAFFKNMSIILLSLLLGGTGVFLNLRLAELNYHIHTSFLVVPIFAAAYYIKTYCKDLNKILKWYVAVFAFLFLRAVLKLGGRIELSIEQIIGPVSFYAVSFAGIYFCMYLAKILLYIPVLRKYFSLIGEFSFEIMAFHFVAIKLVDIVYAMIIGQTDKTVYGVFVSAYSSECWPLYLLVGTLLPAILGLLIKKGLLRLK